MHPASRHGQAQVYSTSDHFLLLSSFILRCSASPIKDLYLRNVSLHLIQKGPSSPYRRVPRRRTAITIRFRQELSTSVTASLKVRLLCLCIVIDVPTNLRIFMTNNTFGHSYNDKK